MKDKKKMFTLSCLFIQDASKYATFDLLKSIKKNYLRSRSRSTSSQVNMTEIDIVAYQMTRLDEPNTLVPVSFICIRSD